MNKMLVFNSLLLLSLVGLEQGLSCRQQPLVNNIQWFLYQHVCKASYNASFYFVLASFAIPVLVLFFAKQWKINRIQIASLFVLNPALFLLICCLNEPQLDHKWTSKELLGPAIIAGFHEASPAHPSVLTSASMTMQGLLLLSGSSSGAEATSVTVTTP
jgi:hypothetical protein